MVRRNAELDGCVGVEGCISPGTELNYSACGDEVPYSEPEFDGEEGEEVEFCVERTLSSRSRWR